MQDVNKLLKQFADMQTMMKRMQKMGGKGMMRALGGMLGAGGMGELESMAKNMQGQLPPDMLGGDLPGSAGGPLGQNPFAEGGALFRKK